MTTDRIQLGSQRLALQFKNFAGREALYYRGSTSYPLTVTASQAAHGSPTTGNDPSFAILYQQYEWIFTGADLPFVPSIGDRLVVAGQTYEVSNGAGMEVCWTWCGGTQVQRCVYAKLAPGVTP